MEGWRLKNLLPWFSVLHIIFAIFSVRRRQRGFEYMNSLREKNIVYGATWRIAVT